METMRRALVSGGVLVQVLLMVILGVPPGTRRDYLRGDLLACVRVRRMPSWITCVHTDRVEMLLLHLLRDPLGDGLLLWRVEEDS